MLISEETQAVAGLAVIREWSTENLSSKSHWLSQAYDDNQAPKPVVFICFLGISHNPNWI